MALKCHKVIDIATRVERLSYFITLQLTLYTFCYHFGLATSGSDIWSGPWTTVAIILKYNHIIINYHAQQARLFLSQQESVHDRSANVSAVLYLHKTKPRTAKRAISTRSPATMPAMNTRSPATLPAINTMAKLYCLVFGCCCLHHDPQLPDQLLLKMVPFCTVFQ